MTKVRVRWFYFIARFSVIMWFRLVTRWQIKGRENIPATGQLLIVANHLNLADPPLLNVSINRRAMFMGKEELFSSRFSGYFLSGFGAFPVRRNQADRQALNQAMQVLADGLVLVIFPEATRSQNAQLQPAFSGTALIALRTGAPILPVGITGTEKLKGKTWPLRRPRITINIGKPFHLPSGNGEGRKVELSQATDYIMSRIAEQLPEQYRGHYTKQEKTIV